MLLYALLGFAVSIFCTLAVKRAAKSSDVLDRPDAIRHLHKRPVPLLGGVALFVSWWSVVAYLVFFNPLFGIERIKDKLVAAFFASLIILIVGIADDIKGIPAKLRLFLTAASIVIAILLGVGIDKVTNPLGGVIYLSTFLGNVLVFFWLLLIMYTTKITDGLDGLSTGIVAIGSLMIYFMTRSGKFYQPNVALLALIFAAVCFGFLIFNFHPASIFLGEGGSLFIGFLLGVLAIISGGKIATALLVISVPALDVARVVYRRFKAGQPIFEGDRRHLHYQLVDSGLKQSTVVLLFYLLAAIFGGLGLLLQSGQKIFVLALIVVGMVTLSFRLPELTRSYGKK